MRVEKENYYQLFGAGTKQDLSLKRFFLLVLQKSEQINIPSVIFNSQAQYIN